MSRGFLIALLCGLALGAGPAAADDGWQTYPASRLGAAVDFPGRPATFVTYDYYAALGGSSTTYTAEFDPAEGVAYGLAVTVYPRDIRDPVKFLGKAIEGVRRSMKGRIVSQAPVMRDGVTGLSVTLQRGDTVTRNLFFVRDRRFVSVTALGGPAADADRFLASFHLFDPEPASD